MHHDLRDALEAADLEARGASERDSARRPVGCSKCDLLPAAGTKLRYCGFCKTQMYCSKACAQADWEEHRLICGTMRVATEKLVADFQAQGGRKQDFNKKYNDVLRFFDKMPGLHNEIQLLAWKHRHTSPVIYVATCQSDVAGSEVQLQMMSRSYWSEDSSFLHRFPVSEREALRHRLGANSYDQNKHYVVIYSIEHQDSVLHTSVVVTSHFVDSTLRGVEIVEALAAAMRAKDLADAFAWIENEFPSHEVEELLQTVHDHTRTPRTNILTPQDCVAVLSRSNNNDVSIMILGRLHLEFKIRLTGLCIKTYLNGKEGVVRGGDPSNPGRWSVRLDDGTFVSVKAANFVHMRHGDYKRRSP